MSLINNRFICKYYNLLPGSFRSNQHLLLLIKRYSYLLHLSRGACKFISGQHVKIFSYFQLWTLNLVKGIDRNKYFFKDV